MASRRNMDSKFRDLHITGKHPSSEDGAMKANTLTSPTIVINLTTIVCEFAITSMTGECCKQRQALRCCQMWPSGGKREVHSTEIADE